MKPSTVRRSLELQGLGKTLELAKVVEVSKTQGRMFLYIEEIEGTDTWRLTYDKRLIPEIRDLQSIRIVREDV